MKKMVYIWLLCTQVWSTGSYARGVFILVHGTWGSDAAWHQTDSKFYKALQAQAAKYHKEVVSFTWKGNFNHKTRARAGKKLARLIQSYPHDIHINIISHSHGSNVGNIASQILAEIPNNKHKIDCFFAFGTPVDVKKYMPNMQIIKRYFNFFSFNDWVQPIFGFFSRIYPPHTSIANLRIMVDCQNPSHRTILTPTVAHWLPEFPDVLAQQKMGNFDHFDFMQPGVVHFSSAGCPTYHIESRRPQTIPHEASVLAFLASHIRLQKSNHIQA